MTRRAIPLCLGFLAGSASAFYIFAVGDFSSRALLIMLAICLAGMVLPALFEMDFKDRAKLFFISAAVGLLLSFSYSEFLRKPITRLCGSSVEISGKVSEVSGGDRSKILISGKIGDIPGKILVYANGEALSPGDEIRLEALINPLSDAGYFSEEEKYLTDGVFVKGTAVGEISAKPGRAGIIDKIRRYSEKVSRNLRINLPGGRGELAAAMLTGDRSVMSDPVSLSLNRSGAGHLASVSGLHVSLAALLIWYILRKIRVPRLICAVAVISAAGVYVVFAGLRISAVRAAIMMSAAVMGTVFRRKTNPLNTICLTAALITLLSPYSVGDVSFQLSFAGTFAVAIGAPELIKLFKIKTALGRNFALTLTASVVTMPLILLHFNELALSAPLTNLAAVPLLSVSLALEMFYALTGCRFLLILKISGSLNALVLRVCSAVSSIKILTLPVVTSLSAIPAVFLASAAAGIYFMTKSPKAAIYSSGIFAAAMILILSALNIWDGSTTSVDVLNNGNICAAVVRKGNRCVIFDFSGQSSGSVEGDMERKGIEPICAVILGNSSSGGSGYETLPVPPKNIIVLNKSGSFQPGTVIKTDFAEITAYETEIIIKTDLTELLISSGANENECENAVTMVNGVSVANLGEPKIFRNGRTFTVRLSGKPKAYAY